MGILANILISVVASVAAFYGMYNYAPQNILDITQTPKAGVYGSTITTIQGSDTISGSRTTINNNFAALNTDVSNMNGSTTNTTLTSAANLATIGTITSGTWHGSPLSAQYGGTGSTTLSLNQLFVGNGTGIVQSVPWGSSGQLLTSNGAGSAPTFQSATFDTTQNYSLTGNWLWSKAASSTLFAALDEVFVGRNATTTIRGDGVASVLPYASTTMITASGSASTTDLVISGTCTNCLNGYVSTTTTANYNGGTPATVTKTVYCTAGKKVIGGGLAGSSNSSFIYASYPDSATSWTVSSNANSNGSTASAGTFYALCVNQ